MKLEISREHGSPYDRGSADFYYWRPFNPHWYPNGTYNNPLIEKSDMTDDQIEEYRQGWIDAEKMGDRKDWG